MNKNANRKFRWVIFGTGLVARKFLLGLRALGTDVQVVTVASRNPENAQNFARDFNVPHCSNNFEEAANLADVDAIYIATPPSVHEAHAMLAITAGKPVLIEKPFAMNAASAQRISDAAKQANVFCMEAMWTRFLPLISEIKTCIEAGTIGEIRSFEGSFGVAEIVDPQNSLFSREHGGGALMHRGIYPLSLAHYLLGPVCETQAMGHIGKTGVDEDCTLNLRHFSGAISALRASLRVTHSNKITIYGTKGRIEIQAPIYRPHSAKICLSTPRKHGPNNLRLEPFKEGGFLQGINQRRGRFGNLFSRPQAKIWAPFRGNGYHYEAQALMDAVHDDQVESQTMKLSESIEIMKVIDTSHAAFHKELTS